MTLVDGVGTAPAAYPAFGIPTMAPVTYRGSDGSPATLPPAVSRVDFGSSGRIGRDDGLNRIRVLIADDAPVVRRALASLIASNASLELVAVAEDAVQAIDLARTERPDVALLDVRMPGGGGPWAAREIRRLSPRTRILALSAHAEWDCLQQMLSAGAEAYILKGTQAHRILSAIEAAPDWIPPAPLEEGAGAGR